MLSANVIVNLQDQLTNAWHQAPGDAVSHRASQIDVKDEPNSTTDPLKDWLARVSSQHRANFDLWHIEDEARAPGASDTVLAEVKRRIDRTNQLRNDLAENLDRFLLEWLASRGLPAAHTPLHSESPGLMIDRLSILALKIFHTCEEADRTTAPAGHTERCRDRLAILQDQRADLAACLDTLWRETLAGARRFKIYRQLKMYNDPSLNPAIYRKATNESDS
ncbi:MAG: DUF4254 domain-containing protein [Terracidiphilus sp.]